MPAQLRTATGIPGLDEILHGGLIPNHSYLLVGSAGTGKTIASLQWLLQGDGGKSLYITLAEPHEAIARNVESFGWDLSDIDFADLNPSSETAGNDGEEYNIFPPSEVERIPMWDSIYDAVMRHKPDRLVIDSLTQLRYLSADDYQFRKQILRLVTFLNNSGCTSFLTYEPTELEHEPSVALAVDGVFRLRMEVSPRRVIGLRSLHVEKMRASDFMSGYHPLRITSHGIVFFPRRIEMPGDNPPGAYQLQSGIESLDELLGGGLESGTTTIISGPVGAGKSTLGVKLVSESVRDDRRAVIFTFDEAPVSIVTRAESVGIPLNDMLEADMLRIERVNPLELYPDEFLAIVRRAVEEHGIQTVMIDSLRGYDLSMEEFGSTVANVHNLVTYLNRMGVTTIAINEVEHITGPLVATDLGVSHSFDNVILLRYAEYRGRVIKVIACLKKRHGPQQSGLREFRITADGLEVTDELATLTNILTGSPISTDEIHAVRSEMR